MMASPDGVEATPVAPAATDMSIACLGGGVKRHSTDWLMTLQLGLAAGSTRWGLDRSSIAEYECAREPGIPCSLKAQSVMTLDEA